MATGHSGPTTSRDDRGMPGSNAADGQGMTAIASRYAPLIRGVSVVIIVGSVLLLLRQMPLGPLFAPFQTWVGELGIWGPVVFGLAYVAAVVLFIPASALTVAAGSIFGPLVGTIVTSLASTTGSALAFLISRFLARDAVARRLRQNPRFAAIDRAIGKDSWKLVALLRLSPAIPFNLQNYAYGLTGIRFWTCVLTSWVAMLPGTLLYVYLGYVGRASVEAAAGGRSRSLAEWAMLLVGLMATIAVTVYITRLARKAMNEAAPLADPNEEGVSSLEQPPGKACWPWGATATAVLAAAALGVAVFAHVKPDAIRRIFARVTGPPTVLLREANEGRLDGTCFDDTIWD